MIMTHALLNGDRRFIETLMSHHDFVRDYLSIDRLQLLYGAIYDEPAFRRIVDAYPDIPATVSQSDAEETHNDPDTIAKAAVDINCSYPSPLRLYEVKIILRKLTGRFNSDFYEETASVRS